VKTSVSIADALVEINQTQSFRLLTVTLTPVSFHNCLQEQVMAFTTSARTIACSNAALRTDVCVYFTCSGRTAFSHIYQLKSQFSSWKVSLRPPVQT
jgi:hypothetical protein